MPKVSMKKYTAAVEIALVLAFFLYAKQFLRSIGFGNWQEPLFGAPVVSSCLLFFVLPLAVVFAGGREPGSTGLTTDSLRYHLRVGMRAIAFVLPATLLFPVIGLLGSNHKEWLGATILASGFVVAGLLFANRSQDLANARRAKLSLTGLAAFAALLVIGLLAGYLLHPWSPLAARVVTALIFVAFLEEFFFRGYVQARLNDCFGKPFRFCRVEFGAGLLVTAAVFGLIHPLAAANETPWAWALWTAAGGVIFGFLREKTGAVIAPAILHGAILIPGVFFGPG